MEKIDPNIDSDVIHHLLDMGYGSMANYIVPGLTSTIIGQDPLPSASAKIRIFRNTRTQDMPITPHSHRFDLACMVLQGSVDNTTYQQYAAGMEKYADEFMVSKLVYGGEAGKYEREEIETRHYGRITKTYQSGQWYFMTHTDIHSIKFSKDAVVLVFEADSVTDESLILEPHVDGRTMRTFRVEDWMFKAY